MPVIQQINAVTRLSVRAHNHLAPGKLSDDVPDGVHSGGAEIESNRNGHDIVHGPVDLVKISQGLSDLREHRLISMREHTTDDEEDPRKAQLRQRGKEEHFQERTTGLLLAE